MGNEMIERVAKALAAESGVSDWGHVSEEGEYDSRAYWRRLARAGLAVMREPTVEMAVVGGNRKHMGSGDMYRAMIDAALEG